MTNKEAARYSLQRAQVILGEAEHLRAQSAWNRRPPLPGSSGTGAKRRSSEVLYVDADADEALEKARFVLVHVGELVEDNQQGREEAGGAWPGA